MEFATAQERDELRSNIARQHANNREAIEKGYRDSLKTREEEYHADIQDNARQLREAYVAVGLNSDGTDPLGRPSG